MSQHHSRSRLLHREWAPRVAAAASRVLCAFSLSLLLTATRAPAALDEETAEQRPTNIVAVFHLEGPLTEAPGEDVLQEFLAPTTSLREWVERLSQAASDPAVKAVVVLPESASLGPAQVEELRAALDTVQKQGKAVFVHTDSLDMREYLLTCGASRISVTPSGMVLVPGLHAASLHVRGLLDKIGVQPDFLTKGAYKSAAELFTRAQPSPEADQMMNWLLDSWYASIQDAIVQGRKVAPAKVKGWLDSGLFTAEQAKAAGLIDAVEQRQDLEARLKERYGQDVVFEKRYGRKPQPEFNFATPFDLMKLWTQLFTVPQTKGEPKPAIGLVYVSGPILQGKSSPNPFLPLAGAFSSEVRDAFEKAAADESIKAVVMRIDSPGGSATASEIILDASRRLKAKKPLVVSMGDVAGSGGYYVACAADTIFADATTLTGSIGVLGGKLATTEMWNKIGITFKEYKRGKNAGIFAPDNVFTESERARVQGVLDESYALFKDHVTANRGTRLKKPIEDLAGGRVYTGKQALELGLVDRLGTLRDAVAFAADQAKLKTYDVRVVPKPKSLLEQLMERSERNRNEPGHLSSALSEESLLKLAAPYLQHLDPQRTTAILSALRRLEILQQEGVVLSMPEILPQ